MSKNIEIIEEVLREFHDADFNSHSTRSWVASQISKKIENSSHTVEKTTGDERVVGEFEKKLVEYRELQLKSEELRQKEIEKDITDEGARRGELKKIKQQIHPYPRKRGLHLPM